MTKGADVRVLGRDVFRDSPPVCSFVVDTFNIAVFNQGLGSHVFGN